MRLCVVWSRDGSVPVPRVAQFEREFAEYKGVAAARGSQFLYRRHAF